MLAALLGAALLAGCGEKKNPLEPVLGAPPQAARIKFFNFAMNSPSVNFYADTVKLTAVTSSTTTESTLGTAYGSAAAGGLYNSVAPGQHTFTGRITAATDKGLAVSTITRSLDPNKFYSYYESGFYDATNKVADAFIIEDPWTPPAPQDTMVRVRFVNASPNAGTVQLTVRRQTPDSTDTPIGAAQPYKGASAFVTIAPGVYNLMGTATSGTTTVTRTAVGASFVRSHIYTVTLRGDWTITSTSAATRPIYDVTANY